METVLLFVLGVLILLVGLAISIGLHEIGHLVPAKRFGVLVRQYMIGFGPTVFSFRRGETQYGFKALPLGGYISMAGMYPPAKKGAKVGVATTGIFQTLVQDARDLSAETMAGADQKRAFYSLPVWKRIVIMLGGPFMNLVLAIVLLGVLLMGFGIQQATTTVASVSECVIPAGSTQEECTADDPVAPAAEAGFQTGDKILSVGGTEVTSWDQATAIIRQSPGKPLDIVVDRGGSNVTLTATPLLSERTVVDEQGQPVLGPDGKPQTESVGFLGIGPQSALTPQPITSVLPFAGNAIAQMAGVIVQLPVKVTELAVSLFGGQERDPEGLVGVVGLGRLAGEVASIDAPVVERAAVMISLVASLNIALFLFNLIPLPPLDGGHVAAAVIEAIRRGFAKLRGKPDPGPIDTAKIIPVTFVVAALLIGLFVLTLAADIFKPISIF